MRSSEIPSLQKEPIPKNKRVKKTCWTANLRPFVEEGWPVKAISRQYKSPFEEELWKKMYKNQMSKYVDFLFSK